MTIETAPPRSKRALTLSLFLLFNIISLCGVSALLLVVAVILAEADPTQQLTFALLTGGLAFIAILLLPALYINISLFLRWPPLNLRLPHLHESIPLLILSTLWLLTLLLGKVIAPTSLAVFALPLLNILAVGLPILFFLRLAFHKLQRPTAQQSWSVFAVTLVTGPLLGTLLEGLVLGVILLILWLVASSNALLTRQISHLLDVIQQNGLANTQEQAIAPLVFSPLGLTLIFGLFSVAVPIIEESAKVLALWLFAKQIKSPVQGFVLGALCGAAFALAENIGFSSTGADLWAQSVMERATAILPHTLNSGIVGWGLVSAWQQRAYLKLGAAYFAAILIHGVWNGISMAIALSSIATYAPQPYSSFFASQSAFTAGEITMMIGTFGGLMFANYAMQRSQAAQQPEYNVPPSTPNSTKNGETNGTDYRIV